jgi:hypothetical protein
MMSKTAMAAATVVVGGYFVGRKYVYCPGDIPVFIPRKTDVFLIDRILTNDYEGRPIFIGICAGKQGIRFGEVGAPIYKLLRVDVVGSDTIYLFENRVRLIFNGKGQFWVDSKEDDDPIGYSLKAISMKGISDDIDRLC